MNPPTPRLHVRWLAIAGLALTLSTTALATDTAPASAMHREYESLRAAVTSMREVYRKIVGDERSKTVLGEVDARFQEAEELATSHEYDMAVLILGEGSRALSKAISDENAAKPQSTSTLQSGSTALDTHRRSVPAAMAVTGADVARRRTSLSALIDAARRIVTEKNLLRPALDLAETLRSEADTLAGNGLFPDAYQRLDLAYLLTRNLVRSMREGEQLLAEKKFATPDEEFRYEQSRNDDYLRLIELLPATQKQATWQAIQEKALQLRQAADAAATRGDFTSAIKTIEESTTACKRIVRDAGLPI